MNDFDELLYGKSFSDKKKCFEKDLLAIEEKYKNFFESRKAKYPGDKHDRLHNHYFSKIDRFNISFGFEKESDLPEEIKIECNNLLKKYFNKK